MKFGTRNLLIMLLNSSEFRENGHRGGRETSFTRASCDCDILKVNNSLVKSVVRHEVRHLQSYSSQMCYLTTMSVAKIMYRLTLVLRQTLQPFSVRLIPLLW